MESHETTTLVTWEAPEFVYIHNSTDWYWLVGGVGVILIAISIISHNYLLTFLVIVAGILVIRYAAAEPKSISVTISELGIATEGTTHLYEQLKGFWLTRNRHDQLRLLLAYDNDTQADASIPVADDIDTTTLRELLINFIPEVEIRESTTQIFIDRIGF